MKDKLLASVGHKGKDCKTKDSKCYTALQPKRSHTALNYFKQYEKNQ
jgi:hypothetical protein